MATTHVDATDAERDAGTDSGLPQRLVRAKRGLSCLEFEAAPVIERVPIGFAHGYEHIFVGLGAIRILDGGINLLEKAEIVKAALALEQVLLAQRAALLDGDGSTGDSGTSVVQSVEKKLADKKLFALVNRKRNTNARKVSR